MKIDFLKGLKENDSKTVEQLRKTLFPSVRKLILSNSGTLEDAEDIFHEAIFIVLEKIENDTLKVSDSFSAYFMGICKNLWYKELERKKPVTDDFTMETLIDEPYNPTKDKQNQMLYYALDKLDARDKELIMLDMAGIKNPEIAKIMGFKNAQAVADRKNSCMIKLKKEIAKSKEYQMFKDECLE